jgi:hypothetical protein
VSNNRPYSFDEAREAATKASRAQIAAEDFIKDCARTYALAEEAYRIALAETIVRTHADGIAWTVCGDIARGDKNVARLRRERDIAEGVRDAAVQAAWRRSADRRDTDRFCEWSMRRDLADARGPLADQTYQRAGAAA